MNFLVVLTRLFSGLFLFAFGAVCTINAHLGLQPWDVLHQGLARTLHMTIGMANILVALLILLINRFLGEKIGLGTLCNMLFIGIFMDVLMLNHVVPEYHTFVLRFLMVIAGLIILSFGTYLYLSAGLGTGPRDGLMVVIAKKTGQSVRLIRTLNEAAALVIGFFLGGSIGIGTLIMVSLVGIFVQWTFKLCRFDVKGVHHTYLSSRKIRSFINKMIRRRNKHLVDGEKDRHAV